MDDDQSLEDIMEVARVGWMKVEADVASNEIGDCYIVSKETWHEVMTLGQRMMTTVEYLMARIRNMPEEIASGITTEIFKEGFMCAECGTVYTPGSLQRFWQEFCNDTPNANPNCPIDEIPFCPNCLHDW